MPCPLSQYSVKWINYGDTIVITKIRIVYYMKYINRLVFFIIVVELLYFYFFHLQISKFQLSSFLEITGYYFKYYYLYIILIIGLLILYLYIAYIFGIHSILAIVVLITSIFLYLEYRLNIELTDKTITEKDIYKECQTGDLILIGMENPLPNILHLIPTFFFGMNHIGIIVKKTKDEIYLVECNYNSHYCHYSNRNKNGVIMNELSYSINGNKNMSDIYFVKTNMHKHVNSHDFMRFMEKYKDLNYMDDSMNCISLYLTFLQEQGLLQETYSMIPLYEPIQRILDPRFYNFDFHREIYQLL